MGTDALIAQLERIAADLGASGGVAVQLERPRNPDHGDYATNLALLLGGRLKQPPRRIAESIVERIDLADAAWRPQRSPAPGSSTSG
jgi:arginyl-tRNA synthetase